MLGTGDALSAHVAAALAAALALIIAWKPRGFLCLPMEVLRSRPAHARQSEFDEIVYELDDS